MQGANIEIVFFSSVVAIDFLRDQILHQTVTLIGVRLRLMGNGIHSVGVPLSGSQPFNVQRIYKDRRVPESSKGTTEV